jgi:hypothetical protein
MQTFARILLISAATIAASCGGGSSSDSGSPASPSTQATLAGSWKATKAEFVSASNSGVRVEIVATGTTLTLTLDSAGTYTQRIVDPGQAGQTTTGTWSASRDTLTLKPAGITGDIQFDMTLSGATLTLSGGHVAFDVNADGHDEETLAYFTMARQ